MSILNNLNKIKAELPSEVTLVAISKTHPPEMIMEAYDGGHRIFGENKVQELVDKYEVLPKDIEWHLVGHLQTNKVKYIAPFVSLIHSVDSFKLLKEINKMAKRNERTINCLLQIHIADEETKFGLSPEELKQILSSEEYKDLTHVKVIGLMGMATFTDDMEQVREEFRFLSTLFKNIKSAYFKNSSEFCALSMGMSGDYGIAIEEGSTMIRVGSIIFGDRFYGNQ
ncbi:MAG: YggS family pyridoxal phosphate-dependent enzyme [Bacteroidales bacterium]|jgi:pyridoxal phosphate enzyme (YggS family)|nr:YggS family pyridoxal phosphate-dependent enzyme [Bacteroidales bacterium]MDD4385104.1 YggS family pyridoxal phosphate-dependent enzyme [Bacteroidales bacterium]MDY0197537.1 YggS family pyridoxal phosphate-dependent enzyme [Tenuifilaceae bacterium]